MHDSFQCDRCGGTLTRVAVEAFEQRGMGTGTETRYACSCGAQLLVLDPTRWKITLVRIIGSAVICAGMGAFGISLLMRVLKRRHDGDDQSAIWWVTGLFLVIGLGGFSALSFRIRFLLRERARALKGGVGLSVALMVILGALQLGCVRARCSPALLAPGVPKLDARFSAASCCGGDRYVWNGQSCEALAPNELCGCVCEGSDCNRVFLSLEECGRAHAHCAE